MQILFNKTLEQCRQLGARGGPSPRSQLASPPLPGSASAGDPNSRSAFGNGPPSQFAAGRAISVADCGFCSPLHGRGLPETDPGLPFVAAARRAGFGGGIG